ncbi:aldehyde dehydrogenase family 3 member H1-like [Lolium rigidum]|uniref:aldehyde dehydrogenase family 3 member H1-like n=1 Tax=Lolium rigidum TaxID=89674 RepID=UPI001F5C4278|nr:aldehyde dehydrogenase family 3 member H1-like [Lolium rigidum]
MGSMPEKPRHGFGSLVTGLQEVCESGITKDLAWRRSQLKGIIRLLTEKEEEMFDVLRDDLGKHRAESYRDEIGALVKSVNHTLRNLERWAAPEKVQAPLVSFPATALVVPEPLGVVLVFSCWNLPLGETNFFVVHYKC